MAYKLRPGYGFMADSDATEHTAVANEDWEIVILPHQINDWSPTFVGVIEIDGTPCAVFRAATDGTFYAQTCVSCRE